MFDLIQQLEVDSSLVDIPHEYDIHLALSQVNGGKAAGSSGILAEILKIDQTNVDFMLMHTEFVRAAWKERHVPQDWQNATLVPVFKKGNLCCDNWQRIALRDVVGKLVARVVQNSL